MKKIALGACSIALAGVLASCAVPTNETVEDPAPRTFQTLSPEELSSAAMSPPENNDPTTTTTQTEAPGDAVDPVDAVVTEPSTAAEPTTTTVDPDAPVVVN